MNDGGPAFPVPGEPPVSTGDPRDGMGCGTPAQPGMSLRDWFAGKALQGYLAGRNRGASDPSDFQTQVVASQCYQYADAMIAARGEEES